MAIQMKLKDVMHTEIFTLFPEDFVERAVKLFRANKFHHLPVVTEEKEIVGIVSRTDLDRISYGGSLFEFPKRAEYDKAMYRSLLVQDIMSNHVVCMQPNQTIEEAYERFCEGNFRAIPIIENEHLVGIVTPIDLVRGLMQAVSKI